MKFKEGVDPKFLSAPAWHGLWVSDQVHKEMCGKDVVCTSTGEAQHSAKRSRHYTGAWGRGYGQAFDLRTWYVDAQDFASQLRFKLGDDYVVIVEDDHIHCHWSPIYKDDI